MASGSSGLREDQVSEVSFADDDWIRSYGLGSHNALDYFALSPFYDTTCNNEKVKMQRREFAQLDKMTGLEYRLFPTGKEPVLFVVKKQLRVSEHSKKIQELYYILDKHIYQAPTLYRLFMSRLSKSCAHLQNAFDKLNQAAQFTPSQGSTWFFEGPGLEMWQENRTLRNYEARFKRRTEQLENRGKLEINKILRELDTEYMQPEKKKARTSLNGTREDSTS